MDPNQTLKELRQLAVEILTLLNSTPAEDEVDSSKLAPMADEMATKFQALDSWIKGRGFLPKGWNHFAR